MVQSHPQYIEYEFLSISKMVFLWFIKNSVSAAKLNLKLKP
jgi:hypothetical protein